MKRLIALLLVALFLGSAVLFGINKFVKEKNTTTTNQFAGDVVKHLPKKKFDLKIKDAYIDGEHLVIVVKNTGREVLDLSYFDLQTPSGKIYSLSEAGCGEVIKPNREKIVKCKFYEICDEMTYLFIYSEKYGISKSFPVSCS